MQIGIFFFFFLASPHGMWDLSSPTKDWTYVLCITALEVPSLNPWAAREVPNGSFKDCDGAGFFFFEDWFLLREKSFFLVGFLRLILKTGNR